MRLCSGALGGWIYPRVGFPGGQLVGANDQNVTPFHHTHALRYLLTFVNNFPRRTFIHLLLGRHEDLAYRLCEQT